MMKRILLTLSAAALVFSLTACGNNSSTEESTPSTSESIATEATDGDTAPSSEPEEQSAPFAPLTLVDNDQVTVTITDVTENGFWGYTLKVFLENKTDQELMFTTDKVSVNGFMCDPFWAATVAAGKKANEEISFSENDFEKNNIESVEEITFTLRIYDSSNWLADDVLAETFTINP